MRMERKKARESSDLMVSYIKYLKAAPTPPELVRPLFYEADPTQSA